MRSEIKIKKRNDVLESFSNEKIKKTIEKASFGFTDQIDLNLIVNQVGQEVFDGISSEEISQTLILIVRGFIEKDPLYSKLAARLLLYQIYQEAFKEKVSYNDIDKQYQQHFIANIKQAAQEKRLDPRILLLDLDTLSLALKPERDDLFDYLGLQTIYDRYLGKSLVKKRILETPQYFWMRVAMGLALEEKDATKQALSFYEMISTLRFVPSTPTLFHAGTTHPQLSSCYITTVQDSLENIFKSISDNAQMSKWSGGIGNDWTNIRGTGSAIKGTGVTSQGVIPFLKVANDTTVAINRSGRRRGATCAYLEAWHYDIESFLELRKNTGDDRRRTHDMDTAVWIPDLFMKRVKNNESWTLFSPEETPNLHHIYGHEFEKEYKRYEDLLAEEKINLSKTIPATDLWKKILLMNFETGHPWITFKDPCNVRSPQDHVGVIHSSNLCTEITLNTSANEIAVCNLGSVNLVKHLSNKELNIDKLKETITVAMRMLDNVINLNFYPVPEANESNQKHRPVGLGIMGFQDALHELNFNIDSQQALEFADLSMEHISYFALSASVTLAEEKGAYDSFPGSKWQRGLLPIDTISLLEQERGVDIDVNRTKHLDWGSLRELIKQKGLRNSNCLAIAPTATISNIAGVSQSIEPLYKNLYVKSNVTGDFIVLNEYLVADLKKINLWNDTVLEKLKFFDGELGNILEIPTELKEKYKTAFSISPKTLIDLAAVRNKWIDQSQSLNLYFAGTSGKALSEIFTYAWEKGLKTTYYLRSLGATQTEKSTVSTAEFGTTHTRQQIETTPIQACRIDNPTCESCQ
ncbi:MAG: ribonucleoside-diphosphate reductase subunit alpha [Parcubacteria group bacterium GW2011_GWC2_38_7]|nr:MAG: ribonucleoside-diphosphate reductase subunit alpha [Parcubacteria group bacterium GW2011_GWC2_38_7]